MFNACLMTRLLIILKQLIVIEYSFLRHIKYIKMIIVILVFINMKYDNGISKLFLEKLLERGR